MDGWAGDKKFEKRSNFQNSDYFEWPFMCITRPFVKSSCDWNRSVYDIQHGLSCFQKKECHFKKQSKIMVLYARYVCLSEVLMDANWLPYGAYLRIVHSFYFMWNEMKS